MCWRGISLSIRHVHTARVPSSGCQCQPEGVLSGLLLPGRLKRATGSTRSRGPARAGLSLSLLRLADDHRDTQRESGLQTFIDYWQVLGSKFFFLHTALSTRVLCACSCAQVNRPALTDSEAPTVHTTSALASMESV